MAESLRVGLPLKITFAVLVAGTLLASAVCNSLAGAPAAGRPENVDFNVFMLVGRLVPAGRLAETYRMATMLPLERALGTPDFFMPWSYPPLFGLVLVPFAALPPALAYLLFAAGTLGLYVAVMRRLGGALFWPELLAVTPAILLNLRLGQNGLLTGGLLGLAALGLLGAARPRGASPWAAGLAVGAMAIKPHLALALPLVLLLQRRWTTFAVAAATGVGLTAISILLLGWGAFQAWLGGFTEVGHFMRIGAYPLHRMTSVYVFALGCGLPSGLAMLAHGLAAIAVMGLTARVSLATHGRRLQLGLGLMAGLFLSPYVYDYDATVFGLGVVLVGPALADTLPRRGFGLLLFGLGLAEAAGVMLAPLGIVVPMAAPLLLLLYGIILRQLWRAGAAARKGTVYAAG